MIDHLPELIDAGVDSFKIEGRNKTAYYAAGVTRAYRKAVDLYMQADPKAPFTVPEDVRMEVGKVSHRNYYTGFYFGREENGQYYHDSQYIRDWEVTGLLDEADQSGHAVFRLKNRFYPGDTLELMQPGCEPYRFTVEHVTDDEGTPLSVVHHPEMRFHLDFPFPVQPFAILRHEKGAERKP